MINENNKIRCTVEDLAFGGQGVAKVDGKVIFIPFTIPGETVDIEIIEEKKGYSVGKVVSIVTPSPKRIEAHCPYFSRCQGCAYQHMDYTEELKWKTKQVKDIFERIGGLEDLSLKDAHACPSEFHYRNKVRLRFKRFKNGEKKFGYILENGRRTLDVEECPIASKLINEEINKMRINNFDFFDSRGINSYNLVIMEDGEKAYTALDGDRTFEVRVKDKVFHYSMNAFFQVNRSIFAPLIDHITHLIKEHIPNPGTLCDLYCGVGFFGILLSDLFEKVDFVEQNTVSCRFLEENISLNNLSNARSIKADAKDGLSLLDNSYDLMIIDPPRSGCDEQVCEDIARIKPKDLIYISCNPSTMARDIKRLSDLGFHLESLTPFDFFPRTKHIEVVALLKS